MIFPLEPPFMRDFPRFMRIYLLKMVDLSMAMSVSHHQMDPPGRKKKHNVARARVFWNEFYDRWNFQDPLGTECQRRCQKELVSEVSKHGNP